MQVTGRVIDYNGNPIFDAHVLVQDSFPLTGTTTDFDGKFKINVAPETVLVFSHVGTAQTVKKNVGYETNIQVTMMNEIELPEVVVTGSKPNKGFNWWWLLIIPVGYAIYENTKEKPKKVQI